MAVKVTGFFQNPQTGLIYDSPLLTLVPHLTYAGQIAMDNASITDAYSQLIDALDTYVIANLENANAINSASTFEKYTPPAPVDPVTP